jgi:hypothetical protein
MARPVIITLPELLPAASARAKPLVSAIRSRPLTQISSGGISYRAIATVLSIRALVSLRKPWFGFIYNFPGGDKFAHFIGPGLLSFLMVLGFSSLATSGRPRAPIACLAAAALLVTLDEVIQLAIPSRAFEWTDLTWSLIGVLVFGLMATAVQWMGRQSRVI